MRYGLTCVHVSAPAVIWTYACECLSAGDAMELRFCISQRRRSYGLTFMHMGASQAAVPEPMLLWLEFRAYGGLRGGWGKFWRRRPGRGKYACLSQGEL